VPRLLVLTRIWPTAEEPSAGIFVANRFRGVDGVSVVVERPEGRGWASHLVRFIWRAWRVGRRRGVEGVEAHVLYPAGFAGLVVARLFGVPLLAYAHGTDVRQHDDRGRGYRFFVRQVIRHADLVVTNSDDTALGIRRLGGRPRVIPPGFDDDLFRPTPMPENSARRVLYLGGSDPLKGYAIARQLADTLAGPGLQELAPADVARLIAEHEVVLIPSHVEGFGLVAAEAIGSGRWVVARRVGGLPDIVTDGQNGTLVDDDDFAGALARVPDTWDPERLSQSVERYRLGEWQAKMAAAWAELLGRKR
jgi:teichuronic acid biosynthesis glycosyltransferase TuaC